MHTFHRLPDWRNQLVALGQILRHETLREWQYTIVAPLVTLVLYLVVFGPIIGGRVGEMGGVSYLDYIFPGLVILAIVLNAYNSSALSLYLDKFLHCQEEWLTASVSVYVVMIGKVLGCAMRSLILVAILVFVGLLLGLVPQAQHPVLAVVIILLTSLVFSCAGVINALLASTFDHISFVPNIVLVPLSFCAGVFYDVSLLQPAMRAASLSNPVFYMVDGLRASVDANNLLPYWLNLLPVVGLLLVSGGLCAWMVKRGVGLKP